MRRFPARLFAVLLISTIGAFGALAPDSLAGRALQYSSTIAAARRSDAETLLLGADGKFTSLYSGQGGLTFLFLTIKADGTYVYTRTSDARATLLLQRSDGTAETLDLLFTSPSGGGNGSQNFALTSVAAITSGPASNLSLRGTVDPAHSLIAGLVVPQPSDPSESGQRDVVIRVVGPSLTQFGVTGVWADPDFKIFKANTEFRTLDVHYADWEGDQSLADPTAARRALQKLFTYVGAFPLLGRAKDAAQFIRLPPGEYTIVAATAPGDPGGTALIEAYFLP